MSEAMPPQALPSGDDAEELLDAYMLAVAWADGSYTSKQMQAWEKRSEELRAMILERMK